MAGRGTRGSQSMTNLSEPKKSNRGAANARSRGRGRGDSRGRGKGGNNPTPREDHARYQETPSNYPRPLLESPLSGPPPYHGDHYGSPDHGPQQNYYSRPNAPPNYHPNAPTNYHPNGPPNHHPNAPPNYHHNAPPNYHPNAPPNYHPNAPPNYHPNAPPNYHSNAPPSHHPNVPSNYPSSEPNYPHSNGPPHPHHDTNAPHSRSHPRGEPRAKDDPDSRSKNSAAPRLEIKELIHALMQAPHQRLSSKTILNKFKCSEHALQTVGSMNKTLLSVTVNSDGTFVELLPNIAICDDYLGEKGCMASDSCKKFHICKNFASGDCQESTECELGHVWKSNHNKKIFQIHQLDSFDEAQLKNVMKKVYLRRLGISVCKYYNDAVCSNGQQCNALHVCKNMVEVGSKCESEICALNHDILEAKCKSLLTAAGIDINDSKRDILTKVRKMLQQTSDDAKSKADDADKKNKKTGSKLDCFQSLEEQETAAFSVVKSLLSTFNYWNFLDKLSERLEMSSDKSLQLIQFYNRTFLIHHSNAGTLVKLQPKIDLCVHYKSSQKCVAGKNCSFLHLCSAFMEDNCSNEGCTRLHRLNKSPNEEILKRHFLINIPEKLVINYLKVRFQLGRLPYVCFPYNEGNCTQSNCGQLHVCYDVLFTLKACYKRNCDKNHDILSDGNRKVLAAWAQIGDSVLKTVLSARISTMPKSTTATEPATNARRKEKIVPPKPAKLPVKKSKNEPGNEKSDAIVAKTSYQLDGNAIVPEICLDHLNDSCKPATAMCPKLHARVAYHWQFDLNGSWTNFIFPHSNHIEECYRDAARDTANLQSREYGRTLQDKILLSFMKDDGLMIDFDSMMLITKLQSFPVRRLGTSSTSFSSNNFSTVYGWYFQDKNGAWIEYGLCDSTGSENHSSLLTSMDIEKAYSTDPSTLQIPTSRFTYTLNFKNMTQTNNQTNVTRSVRRRPKHVLMEKLKPSDPYGLKSSLTEGIAKLKLATNSKDNASRPPSKNEKDSADGLYPPFWEKMDGDGPKFFSVDPNSEEGLEVVRSILLSMPAVEVLRIRRLQNTFHYQGFTNRMNQVKATTRKTILNIQRLFHGTREKHLTAISEMNFEWRQDCADSGKKFGRGAYFFNNAALAHQFASNLAGEDSRSAVVLAVADVYVGNVALGDPSMLRPPLNASGIMTDTTVDNLTVPSIFVKYNSREYCPHYFINVKI
ncbi:uncharacterized protein LOC108666964 isoform X2 [Hyalella azteca]|uniref:Uncharacterized protein LOC108666964 isoform X2 n=1 Tax=Hyalella azteca TaxID=294128 RepID=A0A8B7N825_HYAAZ|nr:uncharacterized protein LOC108666964 isoform X2 [Hyalella azteca]